MNKHDKRGQFSSPAQPQLNEVNASLERQSFWQAIRDFCLRAACLARGRSRRRLKQFADFLWTQLE